MNQILKMLYWINSRFDSGDYVYFNYNEEEPKIHHKVFILNQEPKFTITSPLGLLEKTIEIVAKIICKKTFGMWIIDNIQVISHL